MEVSAVEGENGQNDEPEILDLAIVGAGLSGLTAAKIITEKQCGITFRLFEKSTNPGGQLGGLKTCWITPNHFHAMKLCHDLKIPLKSMGNVREDSDRTQMRQSIGPFDANKSVCESFLASLRRALVRFESLRFMTELDSLCTTQQIIRDSTNMDEYLRRKLLFDESHRFFRFLVKIGTGFYPVELNVFECLKLFRSMSSVRDLYKMLTLQESHLQPAGSPNWEVLVERLVSQLGEGTLRYSSNIVQVELSADDQDQVVSLLDTTGRCWRARYVILAVSCTDLVRINILPTQPYYFTEPNSQLGVWCMTSFTLLYPAASWHDHGYTGTLFLPDQWLICYESGRNQLSGTYFSPLRLIDETERHLIRDHILRLLREHFRCYTLLKPMECQLEVYPIPFHFDVFPTFARRLIFASTNVSCWYRGFINGSIQGGIRAAILALLELRPQTITFEEVTDMQCIHFKYFKRHSRWIRVWYSLNLASVGRWALKVGVILLAVAVCRRFLSVCITWPELAEL
uniref:Amine oxidase n=1 Tax=Anopheles atroparvus TaxID=41427 RepID=A0A182JAB4_ANOAO